MKNNSSNGKTTFYTIPFSCGVLADESLNKKGGGKGKKEKSWHNGTKENKLAETCKRRVVESRSISYDQGSGWGVPKENEVTARGKHFRRCCGAGGVGAKRIEHPTKSKSLVQFASIRMRIKRKEEAGRRREERDGKMRAS